MLVTLPSALAERFTDELHRNRGGHHLLSYGHLRLAWLASRVEE